MDSTNVFKYAAMAYISATMSAMTEMCLTKMAAMASVSSNLDFNAQVAHPPLLTSV